MSKLFNWAAARLVAAFALALPLAADAFPLLFAAVSGMDRNNPVTGETEIYDYNYIGSGEWTASDWQNANGEVPDKAPGTDGSGIWSPMLIDIDADISVEKLNGWELQLGVFGGANVDVGELGYWTGSESCFAAVDEDSSLTISATTGNNWNNTVKFFVANSSGITFTSAFAPANPNGTGNIHYYLKGPGSVTYSSSLGGGVGHVIKMADVTLSGNEKSVQSKTLVTFGSGTTKTFTADAAIKITDGDDVLKTIYLTSVTAGATTITTEADVGTCELVQTSTGIVLYYVDGDPADVNVEEKTYKPSISINFTNGASNGLTTQADVGLSGYEVPGTSWNNYVVANSTFSTVNAVDSTGAASAMSGVSVTISNVSGSWSCSGLTASSDFRQSYIDESAAYSTPTVTVSGIPYYKYRVLVYHSTDTANVPFGYDTINGTNYTYVEDALSEGSTAWGNSGPQNGANAIAEGGNVLVTEALSGSTLTVVGHRAGGNSSARGCIAAIQIIEVKADVGENDLEIPVSGDTQYTVEETKELSGTVYLTGLGTLTLAGENKISAATIEISGGVTLVVNADRLDATTFTGAGTVVYDGSQPDTTKGFDNSAWTGTVWVKNVGDTSKGEATGDAYKVTTCLGSSSGTAEQNILNKWGNASSFVKFTNVRGYMSTANVPWTLILEDDSSNYAWYNNNGWTDRTVTIAGLRGAGTFWDINDGSCRPHLNFTDASLFEGAIKATGKLVCLGGQGTLATGNGVSENAGTIQIVSGATATVASGKTWYAAKGFNVEGTLNVNGTLESDSATRAAFGSGTVVFTGRAPTPTGDAWWKNASWTGTVWIKSHAIVELDTNLYGNEGSTLKFTGVTGYFAQNHVNTVPIELENSGSTAAFNYNNGWGGELLTFSELKGTGTLQTSSAGDGGTIWVKKWDAFTGVMNLGKKQVVMGGSEPAHGNVNRGGKLVIAEGAVVTNLNATTSWTAAGGIEVNGTFAASDRTAWADGTAMTVNSTGILNMYGSGVNDTSKSFANVTGTGTIWYSQTTTANDKWSALPSSAANMFANTLSVSNDNVNAGVIITMNGASDVVTTNANISGTGYFRSDWGTEAYRGFLALQSKNTTWSGTFGSSSRIKKFIVAGVDGATDRTLTLAGTQSSTIPLTVESLGSVNITGTYLGATTVAGTIGGTGTLTGNLTFSDGATLKANASALTVSGTVTIPAGEGESLTIDAADLDADEVTILSSESITTETDVSKVTVDGLYTVEAVAGALKLVSTRVEVTVPAINNATVTVSVGGETIGTEAGTYKVAPDAVVTATYAAADGYEISGQTVYTIDVSNSETTFDPAGTTEVKQYVAQIYGGEKYTTLQAAVDAAVRNSKIIVLANETDGATIPSKDISFYIYTGAFTTGEILDATGDYITTRTTEEISISDDYHADKVTATKYSVAAAFMAVTIDGTRTPYGQANANDALTAANAGSIGTTVEFLSGDPASYAEYLPMFDYNSETGVYTKVANPVAAVYSGVLQLSVHRTLAEAVAAAENGLTVKLLDGIELESAVEIASGKSITIDLNGKTVAGPAGGYAFSNAGDVTIVGNGTVTGAGGIVTNTASGATVAISNGTYTVTGDLFGNVEGGTIAVSGGTYNKTIDDDFLAEGYEVTENNGTYGVREDKGWVYSAPGYWDYTGTWTEGAALGDDKVTISDGATYSNRTASAGQLVTVAMTLSFDDVNDDEDGYEGAKAAIRLGAGAAEGAYVFQLYTYEGSAATWKNATGFTPTVETDYNVLFVLDLTNKTYTASIVSDATTNVLSIGESITAIPFACQGEVTPVQTIDFVGSGTVSSIEGSYEDVPVPEGFVEAEVVTLAGDDTATLTAAQATWLNACGAKAAVAAKIATMDSTAFNNAYLLNLDITGEFSYEFKVTDIEIGDDDVTVTVSLTRTGVLDKTTKINGTVVLTGTDELGKTFETIDEAAVADDDFSEGNTTTITLDKGGAKFFQPVIE